MYIRRITFIYVIFMILRTLYFSDRAAITYRFGAMRDVCYDSHVVAKRVGNNKNS